MRTCLPCPLSDFCVRHLVAILSAFKALRKIGNEFVTRYLCQIGERRSLSLLEGGESADLVNILARILDSELNFNGSADPIITADRGFIQFWGPGFGLWLLGSSSLLFFLVSARFCFDADVGYINISLIVILKR